MWELGRAYGHLEVADRLEEIRALPPPDPLARTWDEQVARRRAELDAYYEQQQREAAASPP